MKHPLSVVAILIICIAVLSSISFYKEKDIEAEKTVSLKQQIEEMSLLRTEIGAKIRDVTNEREGLQKQIEEYEGKNNLFKADIEQAAKEGEKVLAELSEKQKLLDNLNDRLESAADEETQLDEELENAKGDYQKTTHRLGVTRKEKLALEERIKRQLLAPKGVELKKIVVKLTPPLEGNVIEINKEYNFAIIDLGLKDSIKSGDLVGIYRKGQLIAKAVCENIYDDMSSIVVLDEWSNVRILIGDTARLLKL